MRLLLGYLFLICTHVLSAQPVHIIPQPVSVKFSENGTYMPGKTLRLYNAFPAGDASHPIFRYLHDFLEKYYQLTLISVDANEPADIKILAVRLPDAKGPAYRLRVTERGVELQANFEEGAFYGVQTLLQLLPPDSKSKITLPLVEITDMPRFAYRGMHLDVGRHFFPVAFIKRYIDYLAFHKINKFHWHLTEDQGWRIEIKKYPALTQIGSKRNGTIVGRYPGIGNNNVPYGGYYTQEEIKEVVQYAKDRYIEVIPEIEMPGHSSAAIAAYPWLSCFPEQPTAIPAHMISQKSMEEQQQGRVKLVQETWGIFDDVFCAGKESTFEFLQNVIDEVITLFPSKYFHIGGDECPKTHWKKCTLCQQRIKELNLKDEHELQSYFVQRIEKYLNSKGKTLIGWDEILEGGLAPNAIVMSWRGEKGGIEAARQKHQVIMTPGKPVYFDHAQSRNEDSVTIGGYNPIEAVYAYNPIPHELTEEESSFVLGAQANVWTEYMNNTAKVEYMIFPRMAALSEALWTPLSQKNWEDFERRLKVQLRRYDQQGINYSKAYFQPIGSVVVNDSMGVCWQIESRWPVKQYNFSWQPAAHGEKHTDEANETKHSRENNAVLQHLSPLPSLPGRVRIPQSGRVTATVEVMRDAATSTTFTLQQSFTLHKAAAKKITLSQPPSANYPGDGPNTLVNGVINEKGLLRSTELIGFSGNDCEALIDFSKMETLQSVTVHYLHQPASWVHPPSNIQLYTGDNMLELKALQTVSVKTVENGPIAAITFNFTPTPTRFLKVVVANQGIIPPGMPGAGNKAWLMLSEVVVN